MTRFVTGPLGHVDGGQRLGERADLIGLDEDCIGHVLLDAALQYLRVGHKKIIAHELHALCRARA